MKVVDGLMDFASDGRGNLQTRQTPLYLAAVAFSYAVWENYVEDLADELTGALASCLAPRQLPDEARRAIEDGATVWSLAVDPGWRGLWQHRVKSLTKGTADGSGWGLNTASAENVRALFRIVGIDPVPARLVAPSPVGTGRAKKVPTNISIRAKDGTLDVTNALQQLITVRGQAVHTAGTTDPLYKNEVLWWRNFITALYKDTDTRARQQCRDLVAR